MSTTNVPEDMQQKSGEGEGIKPLWVGLAICFFFPAGLYLLWQHPVLSRNKTWWWVGGGWSALVLLLAINGDKDKGASRGTVEVTQASSTQAPHAAEEPQQSESAPAATEDVNAQDETPVSKPKKVRKGINLENYERITTGMTREEVEAMLGKGRELANDGDEQAIVYETRNILTGSEKFIEVHYLDGLVSVKYKDGF